MAAQGLRAAGPGWRLCRGGVPPWVRAIPAEELLRGARAAGEEEAAAAAAGAARRAPEEGSVLLFPGQGSQHVGMGRGLARCPSARELFRVAERVLGYDLLSLCLHGPRAQLDRTQHSQPAVFVCSLAALENLHRLRPAVIENCVAAAGFSIGEYTALVFAGAIEYAEALYAVKVRAEAMQEASEAVPSGMLSVIGQHNSDYVAACIDACNHCKTVGIEDPICEVSNFLFPDGRVIAGHLQALDFLQQNARKYSFARVKMLPVSGAFHTRLMEAAVEPLSEALESISVQKPLVPVYSNVNSQRYAQPKQIKHLLAKQLTSPVKWEQTMHAIYERRKGVGFPYTYEVGPGRQLGTILKKCNMSAWRFYNNIDALDHEEETT